MRQDLSQSRSFTCSASSRPYPRGWTSIPADHELEVSFLLLNNGKAYVPWINVPDRGLAFAAVVNLVASHWPEGVIFHGLDKSHLGELEAERRQYLALGMATALPTKRPWTRSLASLARRGGRGARFVREQGSPTVTYEVRGPRLRYLFRPLSDQYCERFVVYHGDTCSAALLLSRAGSYAHVEELWRAPGAPVGTMEFLLDEVMHVLRGNGVDWLDLGEVPFHVPYEKEASGRVCLYNKLLRICSRLPLSSYSVDGLLQFKQKFGCSFYESYWYSTSRLTKRDLLRIAALTNADAVLFGGLHNVYRAGLGHTLGGGSELRTRTIPLP